MNIDKLRIVLDEIENEVPTDCARLSIRFMWGGSVTADIRATRNGLLRFGTELIRAGLDESPSVDRMKGLLIAGEEIGIKIVESVDQVIPENKKTSKEMKRFKLGELMWSLFLFGFAAFGVVSLIRYFL